MIPGLILTQLQAAQEPKISLDLPILPVQSVLRELEALTGQPYRITGPETHQRIFVQVKDLPVSRLRDAIAEVTQSRWIKADQTYTLETVSQDWLTDKGYRESIARWKSKLKPVPPINPSEVAKVQKESEALSSTDSFDQKRYQKLEEFRRLSPDSRLINRLAAQIPLAELTSMKDRERKVFALNPTPLQKGLALKAREDWEQYKSEVDIFTAQANLIQAPDPTKSRYWNSLVDPYRDRGTMGGPAQFLLTLKREGGSLRASVNVYWEQGYLSSSESVSIVGPEGSPSSEAPSAQKLPLEDLAGMTDPVEVHPDDEAFNKDLAQLRAGNRSKLPMASESTRQRLTNMDKVDPLLFGPTRLMRQVAAAQKNNLVAKVTDLSFLVAAIGAKPGETPKLKEALQYSLGFFAPPYDGVKVESDLITLRPPSIAFFSLPALMNRTATANFLKAAERGDDMFDPLAVMCSTANSYQETMIPALLSSLFGRSVEMNFDAESFDLLKLYGMLTPTQRQQAKQGGVRLSLAGLPPTLNQHIQRMLLWTDRGIGRKETPAPSSGNAEQEVTYVNDNENEDEDSGRYEFRELKNEPTIALVQALLLQSSVTISFTSKPKLFIESGSDEYVRLENASPSNVAWRMIDTENNPGRSYSQIKGFVNAEQRTLKAVFDIAPVGSQARVLSMPDAKNAKPVKFEDLPADYQKKVNDMKAQYKEGYRGVNGGGGAIKPP